MKSLCQFIPRLLTIVFAILILPSPTHAAAGTEIYGYDALGRLSSVTYPDGKILSYTYDAAGNRKVSAGSVGTGTGGSGGTGTGGSGGVFLFVSGTHTAPGQVGDVATATIKNNGTGTITSITFTCTSGAYHNVSNPVASLAPATSATFSCQAHMATPGVTTTGIAVSGTGATNSTYTVTF